MSIQQSRSKFQKKLKSISLDYENSTLMSNVFIIKQQIGYLNAAEKDVIEILCYLEWYFPKEKRYFINKREERERKLIASCKSYKGFILEPINYEFSYENYWRVISQNILWDIVYKLLDNRQVQILSLYLNGYKQHEISNQLNINQSTVSYILQRSLNILKENRDKFLDILDELY